MVIRNRGLPEDSRSVPDLIRDIATDTGTLVRKEIELAKGELVESLTIRIKAAAALAVAGVLGLMAFVFAGLTISDAIAGPLPDWAARLIVTVGFAVLAMMALFAGRMWLTKRPIVPEETVRTVKEDVEWAKRQLKR